MTAINLDYLVIDFLSLKHPTNNHTVIHTFPHTQTKMSANLKKINLNKDAIDKAQLLLKNDFFSI
jgi:hypothetical protein